MFRDLSLQLLLVGEFPLQGYPHESRFTDPGFPGSPIQFTVQVGVDLDLDPPDFIQSTDWHPTPHWELECSCPISPSGIPRSRDLSGSVAVPGDRD